VNLSFELKYELFLRDNVVKNRIYPICDDLRDNLVNHITTRNWEKIIKRDDLFFLWDKGSKGLIKRA